jgi:hypothetical protein
MNPMSSSTRQGTLIATDRSNGGVKCRLNPTGPIEAKASRVYSYMGSMHPFTLSEQIHRNDAALIETMAAAGIKLVLKA